VYLSAADVAGRGAPFRGYHSTSGLLRDGRVVVGGGMHHHGDVGCEHATMRVFSPPYLFYDDGYRPVIKQVTMDTGSGGGGGSDVGGSFHRVNESDGNLFALGASFFVDVAFDFDHSLRTDLFAHGPQRPPRPRLALRASARDSGIVSGRSGSGSSGSSGGGSGGNGGDDPNGGSSRGRTHRTSGVVLMAAQSYTHSFGHNQRHVSLEYKDACADFPSICTGEKQLDDDDGDGVGGSGSRGGGGGGGGGGTRRIRVRIPSFSDAPSLLIPVSSAAQRLLSRVTSVILRHPTCANLARFAHSHSHARRTICRGNTFFFSSPTLVCLPLPCLCAS
jgi:hypothetical protein